jgi:hypothetical protein
MKTEYRNMKAKCIDRDSADELVVHEVTYDRKDPDGNWTSHVVQLMATDPMDAIDRQRMRAR